MASPYKRRRPSLVRNFWVYRRVVGLAMALGLMLWFIWAGASGANLYADPGAALAGYSLPLAGDSGQRNGVRGDGFFGIDLGAGKRFTLYSIKDQPHAIQFRQSQHSESGALRTIHYNADQAACVPVQCAV